MLLAAGFEELDDPGARNSPRPVVARGQAVVVSVDRPPSSVIPLVLLEASTLLSASGNAAATVVLPWLVLERTGSPGSAGLLAAATAVPLLVSSLFSGTIVDLWGRRRTSVVSDALSAVSVAAIPVLDATLGLNLAWLVGLAVLGAVFDPAGVTARETMLPAVTRRAGWSLDRANSLHEAVWGVAFLVGPGVGGVMIAWFGSVTALWATAVGFTASGLLVGFLKVADAGTPERAAAPYGMWQGTGDGLRFVWRDPLLRGLAVMTAVLVSVYMPIEGVLLPVHFERLDEPGRLGGVIMAMSAGGVVGAIGYAALARRVRRSLVFRGALLVTGVLVMVLAVLPPFAVMLVSGFGIGLAYGPVGPLVNLAMQTRSGEHMRGRVVGIITSAEYAAGPVGYLVTGAAAGSFGVRPVFLAIGVVVLVVVTAGLLVRSFSELDRLDAEPLVTSPAES